MLIPDGWLVCVIVGVVVDILMGAVCCKDKLPIGKLQEKSMV